MSTTLHPRIEEVLSALRAAQQELQELLAPINDDVANRAPAAGGWSVTQIVEHLAIVDDGAGRLISNLIRQAEGTNESETTPITPTLERYRVWDPAARRIEAPEMVHPGGSATFDAARAAQAAARDRTIAAFAAASGRALASVKHPHPVLGPLDGYQWGIVTAQHQRRHCVQIRALLASHS
jgi:hypothetical protein